jgi:hypothetical protein
MMVHRHRAIVFSHVLVGLFATGCVTDLRVGIANEAVSAPGDAGGTSSDAGTNDAGASDASEPDANPLPQCEPSDCDDPTTAPPLRSCGDGSRPASQCVRNTLGQCEWLPGECPSTEPCTIIECEGPSLTEPERECRDGTDALCGRDPESGECAYLCPSEATCADAGGGCDAG